MGDAQLDGLAQDPDTSAGKRSGRMATMTATQKRAQAKAEYDAFLAACPSRKLLDRLSDKWVTLILAALGSDGSQTTAPDDARHQDLGGDAHGRRPRQPHDLRHPHCLKHNNHFTRALAAERDPVGFARLLWPDRDGARAQS
jgi:hypothetical protein